MNTLILVYSRSGITRGVAQQLASACGATTGEIKDVRSREGVFGYLRSAYEAVRAITPAVRSLTVDPAAYDLVVLGTPVWAGHMAAPMRTFLTQNKSRLQRIAFFCTMGGSGAERAFQEMAEAVGQLPIATLALADREINRDDGVQKIQRFVAIVRTVQAAAVRPAAVEETRAPVEPVRPFTIGSKDHGPNPNVQKGDTR